MIKAEQGVNFTGITHTDLNYIGECFHVELRHVLVL